MITTMGHIGISLPNIEEGVKWYSDTFDLYQLSDIMEASIENEGIFCEIEKNIFGEKHKKFKVVHLCTSDGFGIELFEFIEPQNSNPDDNFEYYIVGDIYEDDFRKSINYYSDHPELLYEIYSNLEKSIKKD